MDDKEFFNVISLGGSCAVATVLKKHGVRDHSYPFDWILSSIEGVFTAIENGTNDWFDLTKLYQSVQLADAYKNCEHNIKFFHDFDKYKPIEKQIEFVRQKYERRMQRFLESIRQPTLFVRKAHADYSEKEARYVTENYSEILAKIKSFNEANEIIFIFYPENESIIQENHELMVRSFIIDKQEDDCGKAKKMMGVGSLSDYLNQLNYGGDRNSNLQYLNSKSNKRNFKAKLLRKLKSILKKEYNHPRKYQNEEYIE